jgi:hypothetical protein
MPDKPVYITTPIYYVNDRPHIGHAYTSLAADVLARWHRLAGREVYFLTGTDEHGQKVEKAAQDAGEDPQAFTDRVSQAFRDLTATMGLSNDGFIRTTEPRHRVACQALWEALVARGEIYLGDYEGWYAVRDEAFYGPDELTERDGVKYAPSGAPVEWVREPSYFFRLSAWGPKLLEFYEKQPFLHPARKPSERSDRLREGWPVGPLDLAHFLPLGRAGAGRPEACDVRVAGCAHELHHGRRLSRRNGRTLEVLAGRPASGRQGYPAFSRNLLASLFDGRRAEPTVTRLRPWLVDERRPENQQVARQCH